MLELNYGQIKEITKDFIRTILPLKKWRSVDGKTWEETMKEAKSDSLGKRKMLRVGM